LSLTTLIEFVEGVVFMRLLSLQVALFVDGVIDRPDKLMPKINAEFNNMFNDMPNIIKLPVEVPAEIPVVQMSSLDQKYRLNISRNRIDLFYTAPVPVVDSTPLYLQTLSPLIAQFYQYIAGIQKIPLNRVGFITTMFFPEENNIARIAKRYFSDKSFEKNCELSFRTNIQSRIKSYTLNNILNIEANTLYQRYGNQEISTDGIIITTDINNVPNGKLLSIPMIKSIVTYAEKRLDESVLKEMI